MSYSFILLTDRNMALIVLTIVAPAIEKEFCKLYVTVAMAAAFHVIHKPAKADKSLFHFLMPVVPFFFTWSYIGHPAVGKLFGSIVKPPVFSFSKCKVIYSRFEKITGHVPFMVAPGPGGPSLLPPCCITQCESCLQITIRFLGCKNYRDPFFKSSLHFFL